MIRTKQAFRLLSLCALALGVMAFSASAAQAVEPDWTINTKSVNATGLEASVGVTEIEKKTAVLLVKVGTLHVEFLCEVAKLIGAKTQKVGKLSKGKVEFTGCVTLLELKVSPPCAPIGNKIVSKEATAELVLHEGKTVTKIVPSEKIGTEGWFATLNFGEECSIGEEVQVTGELTLKDCKDEAEKEVVSHLLEQGPLTSLKALNNPAVLVGSAIVALEGTGHKGLAWKGFGG
jgi:hypothetical protein